MKRILPVLLAFAASIGGSVSSGCGYHIAGKAELMAADLAREFLSRTRFQIVSDPKQADAVLAGAITNFAVGSTTVDPNTARSTGAMVILQMNIYLTERGTGKSLFQNNGYEFRERYEISENAATYLDESGTAVQRVTRDAARSIVSAILENF
jgi:archaellum component FlaG (FlaF/FlaG flagellin family)